MSELVTPRELLGLMARSPIGRLIRESDAMLVDIEWLPSDLPTGHKPQGK